MAFPIERVTPLKLSENFCGFDHSPQMPRFASAFHPLQTLTVAVMSSGMTFLRATLSIALLVGCAPATAETPLDDLMSFNDAYRCVPSKDFDALLDGIIQWQANGETYSGTLAAPSVPAAFREQVGQPELAIEGNEYRATLPLQGTWQGLPLHSVVVVQWVESESGFYLVFDATPEQVQAAANKAGFRIPPSGSEYRDEGAIGVNVGVKAYDGRTALYCVDG